MAYMSQEKKKQIAAALKVAMQGTGIKYTLGVHHHSTLVMNIKSGPVDFFQNHYQTIKDKPNYSLYRENAQVPLKHMQVNTYWYMEHFTGKALEILQKAIPVLNTGNHDNSDVQSDYFDVGFYVNVNIGRWDKPYVVTK